MNAPELVLWLPEHARLLNIGQELLLSGGLAQLWPEEGEKELCVGDLLRYFSGERVLTIQREGYEDYLPVPCADKEMVYQAVSKAVEERRLWLLNPPSSVLNEPIPAGVLNDKTKLRLPPEPLNGFSITPDNLPNTWDGNKTTSISAIVAGLSQQKGVPLPWKTIKDVVNAAIESRCLEVDPAFGSWPCAYNNAATINLRIPEIVDPGPEPTHDPTLTNYAVATFSVSPTQLFNLEKLSARTQDW